MPTITPKQIGIIHAVKSRLGLEESEYRGLLTMIAGVASAKQLTQRAFEDVMAHFEKLQGDGSRWQSKLETRGRFCTTRIAHEILTLAAGRQELLEHLVTQFSGDSRKPVSKLTPGQARKVLEALKAITIREVVRLAESNAHGLAELVRTYSHGTAWSVSKLKCQELANLWSMLHDAVERDPVEVAREAMYLARADDDRVFNEAMAESDEGPRRRGTTDGADCTDECTDNRQLATDNCSQQLSTSNQQPDLFGTPAAAVARGLSRPAAAGNRRKEESPSKPAAPVYNKYTAPLEAEEIPF